MEKYVYFRITDITIHTAPASSLYHNDKDAVTYRLAQWDEGYTPLVFCNKNGADENILLVNPAMQCASPLRICLADASGNYISDRARQYCESMGVTDGVLAAAWHSKP